MATNVDPFATHSSGLDSPARNFFAITPSDTADEAFAWRHLYVGVAGDISIAPIDGGSSVVFKAVPVGLHRVRGKRVNSTGTTATNMVACY